MSIPKLEFPPFHLPPEAEALRGLPDPPMVVRHLDMRGAEERERIVDGVREARHAADIGTLADSLGADRMMRRRRDRLPEFG